MWLIFAILAAVMWGLDYAVSEDILKKSISPLTLIFVQISVAMLIVLFLTYFFAEIKQDLYIIAHDYSLALKVLIISVTFNLGNFLTFFSIQMKNATFTSLVELTYPVFTIIFTWIFFKITHVNFFSLVGFFLIASGVYLINLGSQ